MKKVLKILTLIMLIFTIIKIGDTYAKYYANAHTETLSKEVGKWIIKVNEMDIYSEAGESVIFQMNNFSNFSNPNAAPDKISPSSKGYSDIVIDPTGTDVAVKYDIVLDLAEISSLAINANAWLEIMPSNENFEKTGENTYTGIINLEDVQAGNTVTLRCYLEWINNENQNEQDTSIGMSEERVEISIPATITVTQYLDPEEQEEGQEEQIQETEETQETQETT